MQIAIRADASWAIGSGHVMRCLTLADSLRGSGAEVVFVSRELDGHLCDLIASKDYVVHRLPLAGHSDVNADVEQTIGSLEVTGAHIDWLVVDHYGLDYRWESALRSCTARIMVIDDIADRRHDCDLLLDQNFYDDMDSRYRGLISPDCRLLLGPRYALLRSEFHQARRRSLVRNGEVRRILVFFGVSDPTNETAKALEAVRMLGHSDIAVDVVVGSANPIKDDIRDLCSRLPNVTFHCQVAKMAELMSSADLAVGAGGVTTWERCCLGLPSVVVSVAANQEAMANAMGEHGRLIYAGKSEFATATSLREIVSALISSPAWLRFLSRTGMELVDGRGTERVLRRMLCPPLLLRPAARDDCENIYQWRNDESTRKYSRNSLPITRAEHDQWFAATLASNDRVLLVGEIEGDAIGVLRYDFNRDQAETSIYLVPGKYGRGYGTALLDEGSSWLKLHYPRITRISAEVLSGNSISSNVFREAGFQQDAIVYKKYLHA